uniref:ShKT domain-containing protein n=1 Tax=Strongyloides venezuelensis TaxID=75913 RepID=A0A0K0F3B6_STRVS
MKRDDLLYLFFIFFLIKFYHISNQYYYACSDSCDFCESRVISDSKITRRRKNYKCGQVPSDDITVPDSFLSDNSLKAESITENSTITDKEL